MSSGSWLQFGNSTNKFKSSYVRGFLDICGNIQVRQGGLTMSDGDISCNGDIYINRIRDLAGNLIVSSGGSGTVIDDTTNLTVNSLTEVKSTSRLTGNVGIGKTPTNNALDISGNTNVGGNLSINGTTEIYGSNLSLGKVIDSNYNLDISGNIRSSGDMFIRGATVITSDSSTTIDTSGAILYIKDTRTDVSNNIIVDVPNAIFKSSVNGNLNRTAYLEIDTTNRRVLPWVKDACGNSVNVLGSVVDGWELGGPGANRFDSIYARDVKISTNTLLIEDDSGNLIEMSFDAATGAVNYNVTTSLGEQFTIKGVQTQKIGSGGGSIDPSLLEFTGLSFGDTFDIADTFDMATTYTYNLSTTSYTADSGTSFASSTGGQNLNDFLSSGNLVSLLGSLETGKYAVVRVGTDDDRPADNYLAALENASSQVDRSSRILIVKKKTGTDLEWTDWGVESDINNNVPGNFLNYIELKNINMDSGTYFVAKTNGDIKYNITNPDFLTTDDLTDVVNGDLFLYVARGYGKNWTKIPVSLPQSGSIQTQMLADRAVTTTKMGLSSVTANILGAGSVTADKIQNGAITAEKIGMNAISASSFGDGSISGVKIATGSITLDRLHVNALNSKQNSLIAGDNITIVGSTISAVVNATIGEGTINSSNMFGPNVINGNAIAGGSITAGKLSSFGEADGAAVDYTKLATDAVISRTIKSGAVVTDKIQDGAVTDVKIMSVNGIKLVNGSIVAGKLASGAVNISSIIADGVITGVKLHKDAVNDYLTAGTNITLAKNTTTGIITISSSGIISSSTDTTIHANLSPEQSSAITANTAKVGITSEQASAITENTAKVGITSEQASAITANTAKVGITSEQASAITENTAKVGITMAQASAITANTAKTGITTEQANAILVNTAKTGITSAQTSAIAANTAKTGITSEQSSAIIVNTAKVGITMAQASAIAANTTTIEGLSILKANLASPTFTGTVIAPTPTSTDNSTKVATTAYVKTAISELVDGTPEAIQALTELAAALDGTDVATTVLAQVGLKADSESPTFTGNVGITGVLELNGIPDVKTAIDANTTKVGITTSQSSAIIVNTAKVGITSAQASAITVNTAKVGITTDQASAITANTTAIDNLQTSKANSASPTFTGNVGIGKTNPTEKLDVSGNAIISGSLSVDTLTVDGSLNLADGVITGVKLHKDAVNDYLTAGTNITLEKNTTTGIITISSSGGGGGGGDLTTLNGYIQQWSP